MTGTAGWPRLLLVWGAIAAAVALVPVVIADPAGRFVAILALLYAMLATSWNLTLGFAGIANFAHMAFFAIGAYGSAVATDRLGVSPWLGLLVAIGAGAASGAVAFVPVLRLRGIYVALVTFVFSQLCFFLVLNQSSWTGGSSGIVGLEPFSIAGHPFTENGRLGYLVFAGVLFLLTLIAIELLVRSSFGRSLIALRDHEQYAQARGVPPFRQHLIAFVASAALAGLTGGVYAHVVGVVSPELFGFGYSSLVLSMVFLGGLSSVRGPVLGAIAVTVLSDRLLAHGPWRFIAVSLIIVVVLWFFPRGLAGLLESLRARTPPFRRPTHVVPWGRRTT